MDLHYFEIRIRVEVIIQELQRLKTELRTAVDAQKEEVQSLPVLRIHDILVCIRIQIRGFMPLTNGSGSSYFRR